MATLVSLSALKHLVSHLPYYFYESEMLANALEKSKKYISKIISAMADSLIVTDDQGIIKTINPATTHLFGYSNSELVNSSIGLLSS